MLCKRIFFLIVLAVSALALGADTGAPRPGVIHFYEPKEWRQPPINWRDSEVTRAEAIFWSGDLELTEGVYDWSQVDRELANWQKGNKPLDLRLATAHNSPFNSPRWRFDRYTLTGTMCDELVAVTGRILKMIWEITFSWRMADAPMIRNS